MKNLSIALAAILTSTLAAAEPYAAAGLGVGHLNQDCSGLASCDTSDTAFKIVGGYHFTPIWGAELGYVAFGKAKASSNGISAKIETSAVTFAGVGRASFTPTLSGVARLGLAHATSELSGSTGGLNLDLGSESKTAAYFGLGLVWSLNKTLALTADADFTQAYDGFDDFSVRALTVGLRASF